MFIFLSLVMEQVRPKQGREDWIVADAPEGCAPEALSLQIDHHILKIQGCLID
jgi:hypothetical protein